MNNFFKDIFLMGDHGGGQPGTYAEVAKKMEEKYAPQGKHVYFCDEVYAKAQGDFDKWLQEKGYPVSSHAGIPDTSTMLYLGGIGTIWGPIVGAVIVSLLPEAFRGLKELQDIAYASVLILISLADGPKHGYALTKDTQLVPQQDNLGFQPRLRSER